MHYATTFAIVFAVITGMSVYFKRAVQSRFAGASDYATRSINDVFNSPENYNLTGRFIGQYEPYYTKTEMERLAQGTIIDREQGGIGPGSIHSREYQDVTTEIKVFSNQLAPKDAY